MTPAEFRQAREFLRLEIRWLAADLGVDRVTVRRWENGTTAIPARAVEAMDKLLGEYEPMWRCGRCGKGLDSYRSATSHVTRGKGDSGCLGATIAWPGLPWVPEVTE